MRGFSSSSMPNLNETILQSFRDELRKEAGLSDLVAAAAPRLKNVGSLGGVGAAVGAVGGAGLGALKSYRDARGEGASVGQAAAGGLSGAFSGAGRGALAGGLAGAAGGALLKGDYSGLGQRGGLVGAGARFGQRQLHSLTGMLTPAELEGVRGGAYQARRAAGGARDALVAARGVGGKALADATAHHGAALKRLAVTEAATGVRGSGMDLTSIPGYLRSVKDHNVGKVLSTGVKEQLTGAGLVGGGLLVGLPALSAGQALAGKKEFDESGRGRGERVGEELGRTVGGIAGGVMPLAGQAVVGGALGGVGKLVGRGVDRMRGKRPAPGMTPSTLEPAEGQHTPSERVTSPAAAGQQPDIGL